MIFRGELQAILGSEAFTVRFLDVTGSPSTLCTVELEGEEIKVTVTGSYAGLKCHFVVGVQNVGRASAKMDIPATEVSPPAGAIVLHEIYFADYQNSDGVLAPGEQGRIDFSVLVIPNAQPDSSHSIAVKFKFSKVQPQRPPGAGICGGGKKRDSQSPAVQRASPRSDPSQTQPSSLP
ncbi:MAG: hypothetical protein ABDH61_02075 [Acidilobaceae archaeon]